MHLNLLLDFNLFAILLYFGYLLFVKKFIVIVYGNLMEGYGEVLCMIFLFMVE